MGMAKADYSGGQRTDSRMIDTQFLDTQNHSSHSCPWGKRGSSLFGKIIISIKEDELLTFPIPCIAKTTTEYIP
jgi:hypothetical protein